MVKKKHIKWSLLLPVILILVAVACIFLYLALPYLMSLLSRDASVSSGAVASSSNGSVYLVPAMAELETTSQTFLGLMAMLLIVLAGISSLIPMVLVSIDIFQSKKILFDKLFWLVAMWLFLGYLAAAAYYFLEVRKRPDEV
ncbi:MAG: hypothetical protein AB1295_05545 [Candidatus Micrarchaeota archaeon]